MFEKFLKSIGVDAKTISELAKAVKDGKDDLDVTSFVDDYRANQRKLLENDEELVKDIAGKERAKILDQTERKVKQRFSLSSEAIKLIPIDPKNPVARIEEMLNIGYNEMQKGLSKDLTTIQQELVDMTAKVKDYEDVKIPAIKAEVENQRKSMVIGSKLKSKLPVADLRVPADTVDLVLNNQLAALYDLDLDDKGEVVIYGKGTKLYAKASDGTKLLTLDDVMTDILKKNQFIKESNADDIDPATGKKKNIQPEKVPGADDGKETPKNTKAPHLNRAQQHAEDLKAKFNTAKT